MEPIINPMFFYLIEIWEDAKMIFFLAFLLSMIPTIYDNEEMKQRIRYNLVSKAESILNEIKERFPDTQITVEAPFPKGATVHLGDANIYM